MGIGASGKDGKCPHTKRAIQRQKTYHDRKLSWDRFEISEEV